jgi:sugar lactone lactonase YvrE
MSRAEPAARAACGAAVLSVLLLGSALLVALAAAPIPPGGVRSPETSSAPRATDSPDVAGARLVSSAAAPNPYATGMRAALALGQSDLSSGLSGHGAVNLSQPSSAAIDAAGDLWVADTNDNRVLEFLPPFTTGMGASLAIGQSSTSGWQDNTTQSGLWEPGGIAFDAAGDLWVADSTNNRVLEFVPPFHTGMMASLVLGQATFTSRGYGATATNLTHPTGLNFNASGALFVADSGNNRVVAFDPPFATDMPASLVVGQATFTTSGAGTTATNLTVPADVALGPYGMLWVADSRNNRVLGFTPPLSDGMAASWVLAQSGFTSSTPTLPYGMYDPQGLAFDPSGDLWVADTGDNRVLEYLTPLTTGSTPSIVEGQSNFMGVSGAATPANLSGPSLPLLNATGVLWVVDSGNSRVVEYVPESYLVTVTETGLSAGTSWTVTFDGVVQGAAAPAAVTFLAWNGSYPFSAGSVSGYTASPTSGTQAVNGGPSGFTITYTTTSSSGSSFGWGDLWWILLIIVLVILLVAYLWWRRRPKSAPSTQSSGGASTGPSVPAGAATEGPAPPSGPGSSR